MVRPSRKIDYFIATYGDLIYDFCRDLVKDPSDAEIAFQSILRRMIATYSFTRFAHYEKSWVLGIAYEKLVEQVQKQQTRLSRDARVHFDENPSPTHQLSKLDVFLHRLLPEEQCLLLLKDKYEFSYSEISTATGIPEGSLKVKRQQALRLLEEWLWNRS